MKLFSKFILPLFLFFIFFFLQQKETASWGFWGHQRINRMAVFCVPEEMLPLYKEQIEFLTTHAVDPDKRRYGSAKEAPRHYIDLDHYGKYPYDTIPRKWKDAVKRFTEDSLNAYGIVPWYVEKQLYSLTEAFKKQDKKRILHLSADLGHYVADAHVPLHTTENYNGQMTNQYGIHGFWESRIPELLGDKYDYFVGQAVYIERPINYIWKIVLESNRAKDSVLLMEAELNKKFPTDKKYSFENRGNVTAKVYSAEYTLAYNAMLNGMVERRLRQSIIDVASFWYTAWVNAGQPDLKTLPDNPPTADEVKEEEELNKNAADGKAKGKGHDE